MIRRKSRSLRTACLLAVASSVSMVGALGASIALNDAATNAPSASPSLPAPLRGTPEWLIDRHGCWTGAAPADVEVPGHVVTDRGYGGPAMVGKALEQIFDGRDHGLVVYAFCR